MLEAQEIFYILLVFCSLWFTLFLCWLLYQATMLIKRLHGLIDELRSKVHSVEEQIHILKEKLDSNLSLIHLLTEGVRKISELIRR